MCHSHRAISAMEDDKGADADPNIRFLPVTQFGVVFAQFDDVFGVVFVLGAGPEWNHRTGTGWVDRYRNYRYEYTIPSRPTIYRDGIGTDRNGMGWDKRNDTSSYFRK
ncbi:hypothetical protein H5410_059390 [Solanum commersonii]|uniref:Uncharacterized protein n=1 Tax=Solanum commersonii TaxID=4109 RepID=A0A9J5W2R3_SOLCO|nr:hypothetical protein H5410_059390 [Solanum commersonii]